MKKVEGTMPVCNDCPAFVNSSSGYVAGEETLACRFYMVRSEIVGKGTVRLTTHFCNRLDLPLINHVDDSFTLAESVDSRVGK